jgi:hypothetical protein
MKRYERKNKGGNHKELQDLDRIGFPHKEEKVIGGNVDLDLLSIFPQKDVRIMGGMKEGGQAFKVQQWRREREEATSPRRKKGAFYRSPHENRRCRPLSPESPAFGGWRLRVGAKKPLPPSLHGATPRVLEVQRLGMESSVPGGQSLWSGKVPRGSGPNLRTKNSENTFWAGVSGPKRPESPALEKAETAETKMTIT